MAFLLPPEEIVYYHYQLQQDRAHDAQRATITVGVTADSAVTPTVIVVIVTVIVVAVVLQYFLCMIVMFLIIHFLLLSLSPTLKFKL